MYHRINTAVSDTWQLCVSPECFAEQMEVLKKFRVISLQQAVKDISKKEVQPDSVVITFDDGYLDNFTSAKSILEKHKGKIRVLSNLKPTVFEILIPKHQKS